MKIIDLALDLEFIEVPAVNGGLGLSPSGFHLSKQQVADPVPANFFDFRGISNPKRWAADEFSVLPQALYEYAYIQESAYQAPICDVDEYSATNSISDCDSKNNQGVRHGYDFI